jgi:hypothetical protein
MLLKVLFIVCFAMEDITQAESILRASQSVVRVAIEHNLLFALWPFYLEYIFRGQSMSACAEPENWRRIITPKEKRKKRVDIPL